MKHPVYENVSLLSETMGGCSKQSFSQTLTANFQRQLIIVVMEKMRLKITRKFFFCLYTHWHYFQNL